MPKTIMIIDDSQTMLMSMEGMLSKAGLGVFQSEQRRRSASHSEGGSKPDMIITDLSMAAMNGIQLIGEFRRPPGYQFMPPRLVAASSSYSSLERRGRRFGVLAKRPSNPVLRTGLDSIKLFATQAVPVQRPIVKEPLVKPRQPLLSVRSCLGA
jgi:two-component system chemotaxis response regulator CheY